jgi:hypothetical protein
VISVRIQVGTGHGEIEITEVDPHLPESEEAFARALKATVERAHQRVRCAALVRDPRIERP